MTPAKLSAILRAAADKIETLPEFVEIDWVSFMGRLWVSLTWESFERLFPKATYWREGGREYMEVRCHDVIWKAERPVTEERVERCEIVLPGAEGKETSHA